MRKLILIAAILFAGCFKPYEKPFVIVEKETLMGEDYLTYQDANGRTYGFHAPDNRYKIGDTIK